jgi:ribosomal protein L7/L12
VITSSGGRVVDARKTVRELCGLGLLDARDAVMTPGAIITTSGTTTRDALGVTALAIDLEHSVGYSF